MENMDPGHGNEKDRNTKKRSSFAFLLLIGIAVFYFVAQSIFSFWISGPGGGFLSASQSEEQPREETPRPQDEEETKAQENLNENVKLLVENFSLLCWSSLASGFCFFFSV